MKINCILIRPTVLLYYCLKKTHNLLILPRMHQGASLHYKYVYHLKKLCRHGVCQNGPDSVIANETAIIVMSITAKTKDVTARDRPNRLIPFNVLQNPK